MSEDPIHNSCCAPDGDGLWQLVKDLYNWRMMPVIILFWVAGLALAALAVWCAVEFLSTGNAKVQIMCAAGFVVAAVWLGQIKLFVWMMATRNRLLREIRRLEQRLTQRSGKP
jgi:hypothetical protein